ncbi:UNVERIFIED_CONTAM: fluoroquinolone transport system permease protein [Acetivibrio alkalicellulosi]
MLTVRLWNLIAGDVKFQVKYGFYFIYAILVAVYIFILSLIPSEWKERVADVMIFTDPAAIGMFIIGAVVLFDKSQRVLNSLAVSPVKVNEYLISKLVSIGVLSSFVALVIAFVSPKENYFTLFIGTFLASVLFTLIGMIVATKIRSMNQFIMVIVPFEIIIFLPPILHIAGYHNFFLLLHPGVAVMSLIQGNLSNVFFNLIILISWILLLSLLACKRVETMFCSIGGGNL